MTVPIAHKGDGRSVSEIGVIDGELAVDRPEAPSEQGKRGSARRGARACTLIMTTIRPAPSASLDSPTPSFPLRSGSNRSPYVLECQRTSSYHGRFPQSALYPWFDLCRRRALSAGGSWAFDDASDG